MENHKFIFLKKANQKRIRGWFLLQIRRRHSFQKAEKSGVRILKITNYLPFLLENVEMKHWLKNSPRLINDKISNPT